MPPTVVSARYVVIAAAVCALAAATASAGFAGNTVRRYSTGGTAPFATALADPALFNSRQRTTAFTMTRAAGATYARLAVEWRVIAPATRPAGFVADDPSSPGYSWGGLDAAAKAADAAGLTAILDISGVPRWAYARRPSRPNGGSPRIAALGDFASALAKHYDGSTPGVPAEHVFQVWNEPNLSLDLYPVKARTYRRMVNAVADSVHAVDAANLVVAGALEPVGHPKRKNQKWYSTPPLDFMRSLLCLSKGAHPHSICSTPVHFDVWSHHPYTHGGPFGRAQLPGDVELGDLPRMRGVLNAGIRAHHVLSTHRMQFWVTEFGWDTNPPRRHAASLGLAARWTAESLYQMWRSGVSVATWFLLQDYRSPSPYQSGLYFRSPSLRTAQAKPSLTAFRFPFVAYRHRSSVSVWGRDATTDRRDVTIQLRHGKSGPWRTVAVVGSNGYGILRANLRLRASKKDWLRATAAGSGKSLAFSLTVPHAPNIGPWGS
ncbi:MAG TPA: cellulase family glycosylhydrolase [Gaiellaceae bacterium]|nr:cellulase family glycosylhydrolase [Gaiellaceae bacterium]